MHPNATAAPVNGASPVQQQSPQAAVLRVPNNNGWALRSPKSVPPTSCTLSRELGARFAIEFNASEYAKRWDRWAVIFTSKESGWSLLTVKVSPDQRPDDPTALPPGAELCPTVADALHQVHVLNQGIIEVSHIAKVWYLAISELAGDFAPVPSVGERDGYRLGLTVNGMMLAESQPFQNRSEAAEALDTARVCLIPASGMEGGVA